MCERGGVVLGSTSGRGSLRALQMCTGDFHWSHDHGPEWRCLSHPEQEELSTSCVNCHMYVLISYYYMVISLESSPSNVTFKPQTDKTKQQRKQPGEIFMSH